MGDLGMSSDDDPGENREVASASDAPEDPATPDTPSDPQPRRVRIVVAVPSLPAPLREEYEDIHSNVAERVVEEVTGAGGGDIYYQVEFRDGRHDIVSSFTLRCDILALIHRQTGIVRGPTRIGERLGCPRGPSSLLGPILYTLSRSKAEKTHLRLWPLGVRVRRRKKRVRHR